jgi:hypothetical protein
MLPDELLRVQQAAPGGIVPAMTDLDWVQIVMGVALVFLVWLAVVVSKQTEDG